MRVVSGSQPAKLATRRALLRCIAILALGVAAGVRPARAAVRLPWIGQKTASDCGRAVLASLAARRGGSAEAIYARIPDPADPSRGYSIAEMRRLGSRIGVGLSVRAPGGVTIIGDCAERPAVTAHFASLARTVSAGRPVVVPVSSGFGAGHYLILVGASGGQFTVHDPASSGLRGMSTAELARAMCGYGYVALAA